METLTPIQVAAIVGGSTLAIIILLVLLIAFIRRSQRLTEENEADHAVHVALLSEANKQRDTWKNEATLLKGSLDGLRARHETDTLVFGRELRAAQDERDHYKTERDALKQKQESDRKSIAVLRAENTELATKLRNAVDTIAKQNEAMEDANSVLESIHSEQMGRYSNRDEKGRFIPKDELSDVVKKTRAIGPSTILNASTEAGAFTPNEQESESLKSTNGGSVGVPKQLRSISSLKNDEAIKVKNEAELNEILKLMEADGRIWQNGDKPFAYVTNAFPNWIGFSGAGKIVMNAKLRKDILPASDFLPAEQPAPTPVKQLSEVVKKMEEEPLKVGDYVRGERNGIGGIQEGEIKRFTRKGNVVVNGWWLDASTCKRVPRPVEKKQTPEPMKAPVFDTNTGVQVGEVEAIDWTKPVAFPEGYKVPEGTKVVAISDDRDIDSEYFRKVGLKGMTTETDDIPCCDWEDGVCELAMKSHELAPINPTDHPLHPEFKSAE